MNGVWRMKRNGFIVLIVFLFLFTACTKTATPTINPEVLVTPTPPPAPESGKASVVGQVMHTDGYPMVHTIVRLADVARGAEGKGGAFILDLARSPGTFTDQEGYFNFQNVKAGEYVIVIGDVEITGIYEIIPDTDGKAKVWNLTADQVTDVGVLTVSIVVPTPFPTAVPGYYPPPTSYPNP
jgi:hypothetical protein